MQTSSCHFLKLKVKEQGKPENTFFRMKKNCNQTIAPMNLQRVNISAVLDADNKLQIISFPIMLVLYSILITLSNQRCENLTTSISIEISRKPQTSSSFSS